MKKLTSTIFISSLLLVTAVIMGFQFHYDSSSSDNIQKDKSRPVVTVGMTNTMKFTPDTVRIEVGETVKWKNTSLLAHSVTADPSQSTIEGSSKLPEGAAPFDSGMMDPKQTFTHTFEVPGTYKYFCIPHEGTKMYGWVIVSNN
ncbi:MAG: plastocyanin/azurin family copper-binding protein [Fodinibius sp.]|nr:plastocyanin/azurin family copper-binding protein [Fodinibius sp.]